ncbi:glycosyltransferase family 2 protein [Geobacter hydrogenophilus]|nr:glycosyltransferase family 2 protein [Geobacter hydrogenophilus]MBT0895221.1 glycosyltransferase family 2 protein [Geobacter hydrogenophilus]
MGNPRISVVIPAYNRERTIGICLQSVLNQTFSPLEIVVVDDRSTDHTVKSVEAVADGRIRCIRLDNRSGAQAARNRGIREAKGDWIAFLDSDDEWLATKLERQVEVLRDVGFDPWTVVHADALWFDESRGKNISVKTPLIHGRNVYLQLLRNPGPLLPSMLVSRLALSEIGFLDEGVPSHQEWDTAIRLARCCSFVHVREPLFIYHVSRGDSISKSKEKDVAGYQYVIDKHRRDIEMLGGEKLLQHHLLNLLLKCLQHHLWKTADGYIKKLSLNNPKVFFAYMCRVVHLSPMRFITIKQLAVDFFKMKEVKP